MNIYIYIFVHEAIIRGWTERQTKSIGFGWFSPSPRQREKNWSRDRDETWYNQKNGTQPKKHTKNMAINMRGYQCFFSFFLWYILHTYLYIFSLIIARREAIANYRCACVVFRMPGKWRKTNEYVENVVNKIWICYHNPKMKRRFSPVPLHTHRHTRQFYYKIRDYSNLTAEINDDNILQ